jgi:3-deoxy-D-manno-octulosonic-acid transferase
MRLLYSLFFYLIIPLVLLRLWWRSFAAPGYAKRWLERFGFVNNTEINNKKIIWIHTVSVGEFLGALPLIRELQKKSDYRLWITTTTATGSERVVATLGDSVDHTYAPYDLPGSVNRFIRRLQPSMLIIMETELWPNTLAACKKNNIPSVLINARLSEKSARGYARFSALAKPMLQNLSFVAVQQQQDAKRFFDLGLDPTHAEVTGNIKFDISLNQDVQNKVQLLRKEWDINESGLVIIAASTHQGEDEIILQAFTKIRAQENIVCQSSRLILVPRHPERFDSVFQLCQQTGFSIVRRSSGESFTQKDILVGDTMGELMMLYGVSDIAFVGGSLVARGGHNFIEPAAWTLPLQSGEHLFNFSEVSQLMLNANALSIVKNADELANEWIQLLIDEELRKKRGEFAYEVVVNNRGALQKTLGIIERFSPSPPTSPIKGEGDNKITGTVND